MKLTVAFVFVFSVPETFTEREYTVYQASDFDGVSNRAILIFELLKTLIKKISLVGKSRKELDQKPALLQVCYACMEVTSGHLEPNLWTSEASEKSAMECIDLLKKEFSYSSVCKLLLLDTKHVWPLPDNEASYSTAVKKSVFGKLLIQWKPNLQRNLWKLNPVTVWSFQWCVHQMEFPHLSNFIELILPPILLLVDDHTTSNKECGTQCLVHMLKNTGQEELLWHGRADVIYGALKQQLLLTEDSLLPLTHEAILLVLKVLVKNPSELGVTTRYDDVFLTLLQAASHENKLTLRRIHTQPLHVFIDELGINSVKYTKLLLEVFEEYLEVPDAPSEIARLNVLCAIKSFIKVAYPRVHFYSKALLKMIIKLLHEITNQNTEVDESVEKKLINECNECIQLLKIVDEENAIRKRETVHADQCEQTSTNEK